jgi:uncharacterized phage protein (TIGR02216 family)
MSARFAESAARLAGQAGALIGWRPDEFWAATPRELAAVIVALRGDQAAPPTADAIGRLKERFPDG